MRPSTTVARAYGLVGAFWLPLLFAMPAAASALFLQLTSVVWDPYAVNQFNGNSATGTLTPGQVAESLLASPLGASDPYFAQARGSADYGALGVSAEVSKGDSRLGADAMARAVWSDTFTIASGGAPVGTRVRVSTTAIVDIDAMAVSADANALSSAVTFFSISNSGTNWCLGGAAGVGAAGVNPCSGYSQLHLGRNVISFETEMDVGVYNWESTLSVQADVRAPGLPQSGGNAFIDALHTARSYYTVLTPGATLQAASGHDYSLAQVQGVAAPSTWALTLAGLGALGIVARRRRCH